MPQPAAAAAAMQAEAASAKITPCGCAWTVRPTVRSYRRAFDGRRQLIVGSRARCGLAIVLASVLASGRCSAPRDAATMSAARSTPRRRAGVTPAATELSSQRRKRLPSTARRRLNARGRRAAASRASARTRLRLRAPTPASWRSWCRATTSRAPWTRTARRRPT